MPDQSRKSGHPRGRSSARYRTLRGPSSAGGTIEQWLSQPRARARSAVATSLRWSPRELRASPAVSPALSRRKGGAGKRRRRAARAGGRERGSGGARRAAAPQRGRAGALRSALAFARWSQSSRCPIGGRGAARARPSPGGGVAASALAAVARPGRHDSVAIAPTGIAVAIERLISGVRDVMASVRAGFAWRVAQS
jgi:hypothetical protein